MVDLKNASLCGTRTSDRPTFGQIRRPCLPQFSSTPSYSFKVAVISFFDIDQGQHRYEEQQRQRSIAALKRRAAALGFDINPTPVPA